LPEQFSQTADLFSEAFPPGERARVVRLAAAITGRPDAAEDLAQEALLEAWRSRHKLVEPEGASRWLNAVTRNVCLRFLRSQGRAAAHTVEEDPAGPGLDDLAGPAPDLEIELEREELADLLDRAMAHLPGETRDALVQRYVLERPQAEIAARLGLTEGAVEARLQRGKISLHRLLVSDYRPEAAAFGLGGSSPATWVETRLWCTVCGRRRLYGTLPRDSDTGQFELHCPACSWAPNAWYAQSSMHPMFAGIKGFRASLKRLDAYIVNLFAPRLTGNTVPCQRCGSPVPIQFELPPSVHTYPNLGRRGLYILCPHCGSTSYTDIYGIALATPQAQPFLRGNPHVRTLPEVEVAAGERPALRLRFESLTSSAAFEAVLSRDRYEVLETNIMPNI
jgi:RNA polymerase sigma-70 factor (ECF subfamily)